MLQIDVAPRYTGVDSRQVSVTRPSPDALALVRLSAEGVVEGPARRLTAAGGEVLDADLLWHEGAYRVAWVEAGVEGGANLHVARVGAGGVEGSVVALAQAPPVRVPASPCSRPATRSAWAGWRRRTPAASRRRWSCPTSRGHALRRSPPAQRAPLTTPAWPA
jgi:hypothetical protein